MIYTLEQLREIIAPIARKYQIPAVYIFGSYARGEATEDSDVDVLIDHIGSRIHGLWDLGAFYNDLNRDLKKEVDIITADSLQQEEVLRSTPRLVSSVKRERRLIYEKRGYAAH